MIRYVLAAVVGTAVGATAVILMQPSLTWTGLWKRPVAVAPQPVLRWEAVRTEIAVGRDVRLDLRLAGGDPAAVAGGVTVTAVRLDMAPDGMPTMTAPLQSVTAEGDRLALLADISMEGRWALSIATAIPGRSEPLLATIIFTAHAAASPAPANPKPGRRIVYYRNPMGLPDISQVPKKDSMGMDYIPVYDDEVAGPPGTVRIAPDKIQRAGVRTAAVERTVLRRSVRAVGTVALDESRRWVLTPKFEGFVEELLVPVTGAEVAAGQPLARVWIENRDILQKQTDYLIALRGAGQRSGEIERAERNLRIFGLPESVIETLRQSGEPVRIVTLPAMAGGTVMEKPAINGMRFVPGAILYRVADLSKVWIMAQVPERELAHVRAGQAVTVDLRDGAEPRHGQIAFVYPELDMATRTAQLRIEMDNADRRLTIGRYVDVSIVTGDTQPVIAIPDSALIDSGRRQIVFVSQGDGVFAPRPVLIGRRAEGLVEVREGLAEGERIVVTGNFLIDSESNLRAALPAFGEERRR